MTFKIRVACTNQTRVRKPIMVPTCPRAAPAVAVPIRAFPPARSTSPVDAPRCTRAGSHGQVSATDRDTPLPRSPVHGVKTHGCDARRPLGPAVHGRHSESGHRRDPSRPAGAPGVHGCRAQRESLEQAPGAVGVVGAFQLLNQQGQPVQPCRHRIGAGAFPFGVAAHGDGLDPQKGREMLVVVEHLAHGLPFAGGGRAVLEVVVDSSQRLITHLAWLDRSGPATGGPPAAQIPSCTSASLAAAVVAGASTSPISTSPISTTLSVNSASLTGVKRGGAAEVTSRP